jgi:hypothetical protein
MACCREADELLPRLLSSPLLLLPLLLPLSLPPTIE